MQPQYFTSWGEQRGAAVITTERNFTGQKKDGTGLLFYNARYYDPKLSRFISSDSIVPGMTSGAGGAGSVGVDDSTGSMLTVDFHEPQFAMGVGEENVFTREQGFNFESDEEGKYQGGPPNPQALNRYAYVLNNPVRYTDPTGHCSSQHGPYAPQACPKSGNSSARGGSEGAPRGNARTYRNGILVPRAGVGGNGTSSSFGSLKGFTRAEADAFLRSLNPIKVSTTRGGWTEYRFAYGSRVWINESNGRVSRMAKPIYDSTGRRIDRRVDPNGRVMDKEEPHDTGEALIMP